MSNQSRKRVLGGAAASLGAASFPVSHGGRAPAAAPAVPKEFKVGWQKDGPAPSLWSAMIAKNSGTILERGACQMPKKKFSDEQIAFTLRQADSGTAVGEICRKMNIAEATFYRWRKAYAGMGVAEIRRLKQLEDENTKLRKLVFVGRHQL